MRYSLANYILAVEPNDPELKSMFTDITIGGEGNAVDSFSVSYSNAMWSTTSFSTGAWVHNKNLAKNGTVTISVSQLYDKVARMKVMCNAFYQKDYNGFTLTLSDNNGNKVVTCNDCYLQSIPAQVFSSSAGTQNWVFTCGEIIFD